MFIEKTTRDEIETFLSENINYDIKYIQHVNNGIIVGIGDNETTLTLGLTDFECKGGDIFTKAMEDVIEAKWVDYMWSLHGKKYQIERVKFLKAKNSCPEK